jgi:hypothetical protein
MGLWSHELGYGVPDEIFCVGMMGITNDFWIGAARYERDMNPI